MRINIFIALAGLLSSGAYPAQAAQGCGGAGVSVQVLGSGGPEMTDKRASSGYLVWRDGRARILVDMGPGNMLRYEQSGARFKDLDVILLTHLHVDHSADLPALIKASFFTGRPRDLPLYGPSGNSVMPDATAFVETLFAGPAGAHRYLSGFLGGDAAYRLLPHNVAVDSMDVQRVAEGQGYAISAIAVHHGPIPALAWRIDIGGRMLAFSGDMNGGNHTLSALAAGAGLLVAHNAVPKGASGVERNLHMPPAVIGEIAAQAQVKKVVLSHRMMRTLGREAETKAEIRKHYAGPLAFAGDGQCFRVPMGR